MGSDGLELQDNFSQPVDRLLRLPKFGEGVGLHRMQHFKGALPSRAWLENTDAIRVTGSKGKGSVSALIAAVLCQLGIRTGLYTSPHLLRFQERIQINGECISPTGLLAATDWVFGELEKMERQHPATR